LSKEGKKRKKEKKHNKKEENVYTIGSQRLEFERRRIHSFILASIQ
jgi:hypothetical protein